MKKGENFNHPSKGDTIRVEPIRSEEAIRALDNLLSHQPRNHALFTLGTNTALRPHELTNIRIGDVKDRVPLETFDVKESSKGRLRSVMLNHACIVSIRELIRSLKEKKGEDLDQNDFLFQVPQGRVSVQYLNNLVKQWCGKIGLGANHGGHTLRKTYGYRRLIHDGVGLSEIMKNLGHTTPRQTLEYLCVSPGEYQHLMKEHTQNRRTDTSATALQRFEMIESENARLKLRVEELMEKDARLKVILDNAYDQIIYSDLHGTILEASKMGMFGLPDGDIVGRNFQDLKHISKEDMKWFNDQFKVAKDGRPSKFREFRVIQDDGSVKIAESSTNPVMKDGKISGFVSINRDITKRKLAEEELAKYRNHLEELVKERTDELSLMNKKLRQEITFRRKAEKELLKAHDELEKKVDERTANLEEANAALRVLLKKRDEDKNEFEDRMMANVKELIMPFLEKLKNSRLNDSQRAFVDIIEYNLNDIVSPFARELSSKFLNLTPTEIKISNLIKQGKSTKEVSGMLYMSTRTIDTHRFNIRKKLGINNKRANLQTHLLSME